MYTVEKKKRERNRNTDRILVLSLVDGKKPASSSGLVDPRLFTGGNQLHAIQDSATCLWSMKYEAGAVPPVLRQRYTTFGLLLNHAKTYFAGRNIEIKEVID